MNKKYIYALMVTMLLFTFVGYSYSWFTVAVQGNDMAEDIVTETGSLSLLYTDTLDLNLENAKPGDIVTKTFTVKNTGTLDTEYSINLVNLINTIENDELKISLECVSKNSNNSVSGTCKDIEKVIPYSGTESSKKLKDNISIATGFTHEYTLTIEFIERNINQNYNQGKIFSGKINIDSATPKVVNNCAFDGELLTGAQYINGQYTYRYKQEESGLGWQIIYQDGWGVILTDKESTDPVNTKLCTSINDKPIVSMAYMFDESMATSIDVSGFDTSKVTNMSYMFSESKAISLDLSGFDTSNVTNMKFIFYNSQANKIYVGDEWNMDKVTNFANMFGNNANLVGGAGTTYSDSNPKDKTYAHVDGGPSNPGYFTFKTN